MPVVAVSVTSHASDASATQAGPFNAEWASTSLHFGTHKSGLAQQPVLRFRGLNIPRGSRIRAASILNDSWAVTSGTGTFLAAIRRLAYDSRWEQLAVGLYWATSVSDDDWAVELLQATTTLATTGAASSARGGGPNMEGDNGTMLQRLAQGLTITTPGEISTARVALGGSATPGTGDVWVEIWSDTDGLPGIMLRQSVKRPISDIALKIWNELRPTYDFTFADPVEVWINQKVHAVLRTDVVGGIGVHIGSWRYNYSGGNLAPYGSSPDGGFDIQNYLTVDDFWAIPAVGSLIPWTVPLTVAPHTTPSIVALLQEHVDELHYDPARPIGFRYERVTSNGGVIYGGYPGTTGNVCVLTVDYEEEARVVVRGADLGAVQMAGADMSVVPARGADAAVPLAIGADLSVRLARGADLTTVPKARGRAADVGVARGADLSARSAAGAEVGNRLARGASGATVSAVGADLSARKARGEATGAVKVRGAD